jgi:hypothetical protein
MYHSHSNSDVRHLRIASLLLIVNRLLIVAAIGLLLVSMFGNDQHLRLFGSAFLIISFILIIAQRIAVLHVGCSLCRTPVLGTMSYIKHRKARRLLGSYQLRVACAILFNDRFCCPCCNEHSSVETKETLLSSRSREVDMTHVTRLL